MVSRPPSPEPPKVPRRKGTRSVSSLTPTQLERKRANDREAQRNIRARTKNYIETLERKCERLEAEKKVLIDTVKTLQSENDQLKQQVAALRENLGLPGHYPGQGYEINGLSPAASGVTSRASSFEQGGSADFSAAPPGFESSYLPTPEPCETWPTVVSVPAVAVSSVVSSPCSSTSHAEDYVTGYIPTSVPTSMLGGAVVPPPNIPGLDGNRVDFEDIDNEQGYPQPNVPQTPNQYMQQQSWPMYPSSSSYYPPPPPM